MMTPKSLLMPLSTSGHVAERISAAISVAAFFNAHVEVLHTRVNPGSYIPGNVRGVSTKTLLELEKASEQQSRQESDELIALFHKICVEKGVSVSKKPTPGVASAHLSILDGLRDELTAECGKVVDLIVLPQSKTGKPTATFEAAIMRSGKPIIVMPRPQTEFSASKVLIAWNGSTEAARVVSQALPVLVQAKEVIIAVSTSCEHVKPSGLDLQQYLALHGIESQLEYFDNSRIAAGVALLNLAAVKGCDLLVMGGFTHRRLHQQLFGGVTRHVLASAEIPIMMMH